MNGILLILLTLPHIIRADRFRFTHYEVEHGLSSNTVRSIMQDSRGFMWFGTEGGLNRFDGFTFKVFKHIPNTPASIGNNYIFSLYEDTEQTFWVGTDEGVCIYEPEMESFAPFTQKTEKGISIQSNITVITEDKSGNIWFGTLGQGVFCYNKKQKTLQQYVSEPGNANTLVSNTILCLFVDSAGFIWATTKQSGTIINRFDPTSQQFVSYPIHTGTADTSEFTIYGIAEDTSANLWLGTWKNGLCKLDKQTGKIESYLKTEGKNTFLHIHSLINYQPDKLLIGSDDGMACFNTQTKEAEFITASEYEHNSLSSKFIYPIYKDREGGIWVGTYYGGINYAPPAKGSIQGYSASQYKNSVSGNVISCFCEDKEGNIWIGSDDGGLSHFNTKTRQFRNYLPDQRTNSLSYHNIHALCMDDDKLWIGTYSGGLNVLDLKTKQFKLYQPDASDENSLDGNSIYAVFRDSRGEIWIGSMFGLCKYNRTTDNFTHMQQVETTTINILEDKDRNIWFATLGKGLLRYNLSTKEWARFLYDPKNPDGLPGNQINSLCLDNQEQLWIGTDNGLCKYDAENNTFSSVSLNVPNTFVCSITAEQDDLWIGTMYGLISYSLKSGKHHLFHKNDGLQSDQFNPKASLLSTSGELYLGTINGFNVLTPQSVSRNEYIPPVVITNLQIFNKDVQIGENHILKRSVNFADTIELSYKDNVFNIEYVALSYSVPSKNQYKYILKGFDKDWNLMGNQRKATYTNLPSGTYQFRVAGSNNDGNWNEDGASLVIIIHPPFYQTPLASVFYIILIIGLLTFIIYILRQRTEKRHKEKMQQLRAEKEKELHDAKINFFTLIAHEIRTPVTLIIGPLEKVMENFPTLPERIQNDLHTIDRNSRRLLSLVNQLLDFRKAEQGAFVIHLSDHNVQDLLQNLFDRFKPLIEQKGIAFSFSMDDPALKATIDAEALTKIVSNLLTNAAKYARQRILLACSSDSNSFVIRVSDDGPGITEAEQKNIFVPFYQVAQSHKPGTGIGLSLVKLLTDALHGQVDVESATGKQTVFSITLPIRQTYQIEAEKKEPAEQELYLVSETENTGTTNKPDRAPGALPVLLIVEDNTDMRSFIQESFVSSYTILMAENGQEGLEQLKKHPADLIISDVMMPVMDGITFCKEVKANLLFCHIPLVLLTAKTDDASRISGIRNGADVYVEKPFSVAVLRAQIENLLESRKLLQKKFSEMPFVPLGSIARNDADEQFLSRMNAIIDQNISNVEFSIDVLAGQLGISRSGLFAKIKNLAEMTPNELIQLVRLKKAAGLLATRKYRINEICYQVGFNNPSYFSKCFQKQFGVLPKDFINKTN